MVPKLSNGHNLMKPWLGVLGLRVRSRVGAHKQPMNE